MQRHTTLQNADKVSTLWWRLSSLFMKTPVFFVLSKDYVYLMKSYQASTLWSPPKILWQLLMYVPAYSGDYERWKWSWNVLWSIWLPISFLLFRRIDSRISEGRPGWTEGAREPVIMWVRKLPWSQKSDCTKFPFSLPTWYSKSGCTIANFAH